MLLDYSISDVAPHINWDYFFYAWGMHTQPQAERDQLQAEAESVLAGLQDKYRTHALFQLFDANSQGDDIVLAHRNIPLLRQHDVIALTVGVEQQKEGMGAKLVL